MSSDGASTTIPVKLTLDQLAAIKHTDSPVSQWVREAVEARLIMEVPEYAREHYRSTGTFPALEEINLYGEDE